MTLSGSLVATMDWPDAPNFDEKRAAVRRAQYKATDTLASPVEAPSAAALGAAGKHSDWKDDFRKRCVLRIKRHRRAVGRKLAAKRGLKGASRDTVRGDVNVVAGDGEDVRMQPDLSATSVAEIVADEVRQVHSATAHVCRHAIGLVCLTGAALVVCDTATQRVS